LSKQQFQFYKFLLIVLPKYIKINGAQICDEIHMNRKFIAWWDFWERRGATSIRRK